MVHLKKRGRLVEVVLSRIWRDWHNPLANARPETVIRGELLKLGIVVSQAAVTGLVSDQRYYYAIGTTTAVLEGDDATHTFATLQAPGTETPTRVWVIGDAGTGSSEQIAVRDAWTSYSGGQPPDVWLMLGDNAYDAGLDTEYQSKVFDLYKSLLKNTTLWPTRVNHDVLHSGANNDYYEIFSMPTSGQSGGLASGTEAYYSYDFGNIHFICLDSEGTDRSPSGAMVTWLKNDLASTGRDWVIAGMLPTSIGHPWSVR